MTDSLVEQSFEDKDMSFWDHLIELRARLIKSILAAVFGMGISLIWLEEKAYELALRPLGDKQLMYLGLSEAFTTHLFLAMYLGLVVALPVIAYQMWSFVTPGLYPNERTAALSMSLVSTLLFIMGVAFAYFVLMPIVVMFFLGFEQPGLTYGGALGPYLRLISGILIGTGVAFQLPIVLFGLIKSGVVSVESIGKQRPYWFLGIVIAAAILTPTGDIVTQMTLAVPMYILFELALLAAKIGKAGVR